MGRNTRSTGTRSAVATRVALLGSLLLILTTGMTASSGDLDATRAVLDRRSLPLSEVSRHHCHDRDFPIIRCFPSPDQRDEDLAAAGAGSAESGQPYVTVYLDEGYGGGSLTVYDSIRDLGMHGWNDRISSFKSLNGQRPRLFSHIDFGTPSWRWPAGAWVSNVGSNANDATSSITNDP